mmetsp:Transcript_34001/g.108519  ORF Transcript_34001/g.108519 Transcript_34001/m.108519 type:complete len:453 (+) Transcript_34001:613-1971(+)
MGARKFGSLYRSRYSLVVATVSTTTSAVRGSSKQFQKWLLTKRAPPLESTRERFVARSRSSQRSSSSWCRNRSMPPLVLSGLRAPNESSLASTKRGVTHGECECWMSFFRGSVARETRTVRRSPAVGRSSEKHAWSVRGLPGTGPGPGFGHGCCTKHALPSQAGCAYATCTCTCLGHVVDASRTCPIAGGVRVEDERVHNRAAGQRRQGLRVDAAPRGGVNREPQLLLRARPAQRQEVDTGVGEAEVRAGRRAGTRPEEEARLVPFKGVALERHRAPREGGSALRAAVTGGVEREADHLGQAIKVVPHPVREGAWDEAIVNQARHPRRRPLADGGAGRDGRVAQHVAQEAARTALARRERAALARREPLRGRKETASDEGFPGGIGHDVAPSNLDCIPMGPPAALLPRTLRCGRHHRVSLRRQRHLPLAAALPFPAIAQTNKHTHTHTHTHY